jgi:hypothetical protein
MKVVDGFLSLCVVVLKKLSRVACSSALPSVLPVPHTQEKDLLSMAISGSSNVQSTSCATDGSYRKCDNLLEGALKSKPVQHATLNAATSPLSRKRWKALLRQRLAPSTRMQLSQEVALLLALFRGIYLAVAVLSLNLSTSRLSIASIAS